MRYVVAILIFATIIIVSSLVFVVLQSDLESEMENEYDEECKRRNIKRY